jgi:hypothetical protein
MQRIVMVMSLMLAACSAPPPPQTPKAPSQLAAADPAWALARRNLDDDPDVTCRLEVTTGTTMSRPICRSNLERQESVRQAWEMLTYPAGPLR